MKAYTYRSYGSVDQLQLSDIPTPRPGAGGVLVKIKSASINSWDWDLLRGKPYIVRLGGWLKPRFPTLGADVAGIVEELGEGVNSFQPGDAVVGDLSNGSWGAFADYACAPAKSLVRKPSSVSFEEAAAIPQAGVMALQAIQDYGKVQRGDRVLINGAGGGVGSFAIQLAKQRGAVVTGVDRNDKLEFMKSLGADHVIDYETTDFADGGNRYDLVLDVQLQRSFAECRRALTDQGKYVVVGGIISKIFGHWLKQMLQPRGNKQVMILTHQANYNLTQLLQMVEAGALRASIDQVVPLSELPGALQRFGRGDVKGKIIVVP